MASICSEETTGLILEQDNKLNQSTSINKSYSHLQIPAGPQTRHQTVTHACLPHREAQRSIGGIKAYKKERAEPLAAKSTNSACKYETTDTHINMFIQEPDSTTGEQEREMATEQRELEDGINIRIFDFRIDESGSARLNILILNEDGTEDETDLPAIFVANNFPIKTTLYIMELFEDDQSKLMRLITHAPELIKVFVEPLLG